MIADKQVESESHHHLSFVRHVTKSLQNLRKLRDFLCAKCFLGRSLFSRISWRCTCLFFSTGDKYLDVLFKQVLQNHIKMSSYYPILLHFVYVTTFWVIFGHYETNIFLVRLKHSYLSQGCSSWTFQHLEDFTTFR